MDTLGELIKLMERAEIQKKAKMQDIIKFLSRKLLEEYDVEDATINDNVVRIHIEKIE